MSQHRSRRRGGVAAGGGSTDSTSVDGEVRVGLTDSILGNGPEVLQYGKSVFADSVGAFFYAIRVIRAKYGAQQQRTVYLASSAVGFPTAAQVYPFMPFAKLF